ncbi:MAG: ABC transporter permease [Ruminococcaceae bacterium]|nr:ABC transporter permease [Oscillospiraceae bacterium]
MLTDFFSRFHIVKKTNSAGTNPLLLSFLSLVAALIIGGLFILCLGKNPFAVYGVIIEGAFKIARTGAYVFKTIGYAIPLVITSIAVSIAFKMKFWNIGAEGQMIAGAVLASYFALFQSQMPHWLLLLIMVLAGAVGGGLLGTIPAFFKCKFDTNETLFTLMLNYIALSVITYLKDGPWSETPGFPGIAKFADNARLDIVGGVHIGWIFTVLLVVAAFIYMRYTKHGYEISVIGDSINTARYAGMNVNRVILRTMFISGALCGIAGMIQVSGIEHTLGESVAGGRGFTAIIIAWLSRLNPFVCVLFSMLFATLQQGCSGSALLKLGLSPYVADILQGIILFVILAFDFFTQYKIVYRGRKNA